MDTPVGRARDAATWRFPHDKSMSNEQHAFVSAHRAGFKYGAAWSRTDALTDPTDTEIENAAITLFQADELRIRWSAVQTSTREYYMSQARAVLSSFLTGRRAEG